MNRYNIIGQIRQMDLDSRVFRIDTGDVAMYDPEYEQVLKKLFINGETVSFHIVSNPFRKILDIKDLKG